MTRLIISLIFSGSLILGSCTNSPKSNPNNTHYAIDVPDDFIYFLDEFHSDTVFQKAHIQWPLQGLPTWMNGNDTTIVDDSFRWTEDNWVMHRDFDQDNEEFEQKFSTVGDDIVIEQILHINGSMGMERRFSRRDDSWVLIYYAGMNLIRQ